MNVEHSDPFMHPFASGGSARSPGGCPGGDAGRGGGPR